MLLSPKRTAGSSCGHVSPTLAHTTFLLMGHAEDESSDQRTPGPAAPSCPMAPADTSPPNRQFLGYHTSPIPGTSRQDLAPCTRSHGLPLGHFSLYQLQPSGQARRLPHIWHETVGMAASVYPAPAVPTVLLFLSAASQPMSLLSAVLASLNSLAAVSPA